MCKSVISYVCQTHPLVINHLEGLREAVVIKGVKINENYRTLVYQ